MSEALVISDIGRLEFVRAAHRISPPATTHSQRLLLSLDTLRVTDTVIGLAQAIGPSLPTLQALHLAAAVSIRRGLTALCSYDRCLLDAAVEVGLPTASPR